MKKLALLLCYFLIIPLGLKAQIRGTHLLGDAGLHSGTQSPPSISILMVPVYNYHTSKFIDFNGNAVSTPSLNAYVLGLGGYIVTNFKILGANYGAVLLLAMASNKFQGNQVHSVTPLTFSDMYIQPVQLGWHIKRADFFFGYSLYLPTGRFHVGANNNAGLGMFTNEFTLGSTLYFDKKKLFSFSALANYAINSKKKQSDLKAGNILSIEGGLGKTFYIPVKNNPVPLVLSFGPMYYMQFKVSDDQIPIGNQIFSGPRDRIYAIGGEANIFIPKPGLAFAVRWLEELGAFNRFQGNSLLVTAAYVIPFAKKSEAKEATPKEGE